jgi:putative transposase
MPNYRRWRVPGGSYFFTLNLHDRSQRLLVDHIDVLRAAFRAIQRLHPFHIDAIVVLPEHLHCVWTLPEADDDYSTRWRKIKATFSRTLLATEWRSSSRRRRHERGIWQRRFWEHVLRDENDYAAHVDYIHFNPVKHGHCERAVEWPHSSIHDYIRRGILSADWGTAGFHTDLDLD